MITGKTKTGFKYTIDERIKSDWRMVKVFDALRTGDEQKKITACMTLINLLFADGGEVLERHVACLNNGFVPVDKLMNELSDIISSNNTTKKS